MEVIESPAQKPPLNLWAVYGICLLTSFIFFTFWGFNSFIYPFNAYCDYHWFLTMGNGWLHGKIPYHDLFEQKGPLTYTIFVIANLFPQPKIFIWLVEIICMSLFLLVCYRFCHQRLSQFNSLLAISVIALTLFSAWCRVTSGAVVEEFCLPIFMYFFYCFVDYLLNHRNWDHWRSLFLGLCFGIIIWVKYTMLYFMLVPMMIWFVINLRNHTYRNCFKSIGMMCVGMIIITIPVIIYFAANHALGDLINCYFIINMTKYGFPSFGTIIGSLGIFFTIGPLLLLFMLGGVTYFTIKHWHEKSGWLLLICFVVNLVLLVYSSKLIAYYYVELIPYSILGVVVLIDWLVPKIKWHLPQIANYGLVTMLCLLLCVPTSILSYEWGRRAETYAPVQVANAIHTYEQQTGNPATMFCYKIGDFGFYNAAGIVPNHYYWANNVFDPDKFPELYTAFHDSITAQTSDFVVTERRTWDAEQSFLNDYYAPYTGDIETSTFTYRQVHYFFFRTYQFVLLQKTAE